MRLLKKAGARLVAACKVAGITMRNLQRWKREGGLLQRDRRVDSVRPRLAHALTNEERQAVLAVANEARIADCHRPAHRSQLMIGTMEPGRDRHMRCPTFSAFQPVALMLPFLADPVVRSSSAGTWSGTGIPGWSGGGSGCRTRRCTGTGRSQPRRASRSARHAPARS